MISLAILFLHHVGIRGNNNKDRTAFWVVTKIFVCNHSRGFSLSQTLPY